MKYKADNFPLELDGYNLILLIGFFDNGRPALHSKVSHTEEPYARFSVNIPDLELPDDYTFIRDIHENIIPVLVEAGLVEDTRITKQTGHTYAHLVKLL